MKKFIYSAVEGEQVRIEIEGDLKDVLVAVSELINMLYSSYCRHSPIAASFFQLGIQRLVNDQTSPTWNVQDLPAGGIEIVTAKPKGGSTDGE